MTTKRRTFYYVSDINLKQRIYMNNYVFPLPVPAHIVFSIIGFIFFMFMYFRKKYVYHLLLSLAIPSTLLIYLCKGSKLLYSLFGLEQLILIILIFVFIVVAKRKETKTQNSQNKASAEETDENSNA